MSWEIKLLELDFIKQTNRADYPLYSKVETTTGVESQHN